MVLKKFLILLNVTIIMPQLRSLIDSVKLFFVFSMFVSIVF